MRGQVLFFDAKKRFGILVAEGGEQHFFSGHDLAEPVKSNDWAVFDSEPKVPVPGSKFDWHAQNIYRIECPPEFLLYGHIHCFFSDKHFGFITYESAGRKQSIFFHCSDLIRPNGVEPIPSIGDRVSFCLGLKNDKQIAAQIWIEQRPENGMHDIETYFEEAPELPVEVPGPSVSSESVLSTQTKALTLFEIMRIRREEICSTVARKR
jgi:cold shock CspA family protein